jgi:OOP family OmpA-OmpF porin
MSTNLLETLQSLVTPDLLQKASSLVGEDPASTQRAIGGIFPTLLAGITSKFSSGSGIGQLLGMLPDPATSSNLLSNAASAFGGGATSNSLADQGQGLLRTIFGDRINAVTDLIGAHSGIKGSSALSLLSLAAPLVMGVLGKASQGLGASGLASLLHSQAGSLARFAPAGLASALGIGNLSNLGGVGNPVVAQRVTDVPEVRSGTPKWLWPLLIALAVLLGVFAYLHGCSEKVREGFASISLPNGTKLELPTGSLNYQLATFLADKNDTNVPRTFVFDHLNFDSATATLTAESNQTVTDLSTILKAYPDASVRLDGYTDSTGDPGANRMLSQSRADAVKTLLTQDGIDGGRIATSGNGEDKPIASNDTEDGRAKNRRTELTVIQK